MDTSLSAAPVMPLPASSSQAEMTAFSMDRLPWESAPAEAPRAFREAPRKPSPAQEPRIVAEPIPWAIVALTLATALFVALGAWAGGASESRVMTFAADAPAD